MASCYGGEIATDRINDGTRDVATCCPYLPLTNTLIMDGKDIKLELSCFKNKDEILQGFNLMNDVIVEGKSWPFADPYDSVDSYSSYFHSHASFAVRFSDQATYGYDILGCFYIKPNFPGRCAHICNGGFISNPKYRNMGIGTFMGQSFKRLARDLGYKGSLFNLVFANNTASIKLWLKLGFTQLAVLPKAAELRKGSPESTETEMVDAIQMYFDLTKHDGAIKDPDAIEA